MTCQSSVRHFLVRHPALLHALGFVLCLIFAAAPALARQEEDAPVHDGRLDGYASTVALSSTSTALTWLLLVALAVVCLGVLFKDAKRSYLD